MAQTFVHIRGMAELHKALQELPAKIEGNVMRGALRAGQKVFLEAAKAAAPVDRGALRDSIKIRFKPKSQRFGWVRMHLVAGNEKAWYSHLIEYGTASYYTGQGKTVGKPYVISGKTEDGLRYGQNEKRRINRGSAAGALFWQGQMATKVIHPGIKPQPFMRPAFDNHQQQALDATVNYIRTRLPKELKKAGK